MNTFSQDGEQRYLKLTLYCCLENSYFHLSERNICFYFPLSVLYGCTVNFEEAQDWNLEELHINQSINVPITFTFIDHLFDL